ncbi:MAG: NifU family protein [candidate division WOR-3 bacterium]|nr:NifU family protein [candidate division WOR-3 bacterium]MCX7756776.1 NifU family protein [candidate division WOR-3 bacterium]MDW7987731.1 NifU family protein [candidate division WOR-3 bacterium]
MTEETKKKINDIIQNKVRPNLIADGGDIELVEITDNGIVKVRLKGKCGACPFSQITLALGVEKILKDAIAEVQRVELA